MGQQVTEGVEELLQPRLVPHALLDHLLLAQVLSTALDGQGLQGLKRGAAAGGPQGLRWEEAGGLGINVLGRGRLGTGPLSLREEGLGPRLLGLGAWLIWI